MSTAARKAQKRAGEKFVRTPKVGTPLLERAEFAGQVYGPVKGRARWHWRSKKKVARAAAARGIEVQ